MALNITSGKIAGAQKVVVYGPEGIGKTTFAAQFPNPLFIDTEGSTKHLDVKRLDPPSSWTMLMREIADVKTSPGACGTLVLDTVDWAEKLCVEHVCAEKQVKGIEDMGYGKGYTYLAEEFGRLLNALGDLTERGVNVCVTAHAQMRKFEQPDELGAYDRWELKLSKKTAPLVKEWADMVLFANYETVVVNVDNQGAAKGKNKVQGGKRVMHASHHPCWDAKNRVGLPDKAPFDFAQIAQHIPSHPEPAADPSPAPAPLAAAAPSTAPKPVQTVVFNADGTVASDTARSAKRAEEMVPDHLKPLFDLMERDGVNQAQVRDAVASKGYFTIDTPIENYPADFVQGVLVAAWEQVRQIIESRKPYTEPLPFD